MFYIFVTRDHFEKWYDKEKYLQKSRSLLNIKDNFKKIITYDPELKHYTDDGILIINIYDFLLDLNSLDY